MELIYNARYHFFALLLLVGGVVKCDRPVLTIVSHPVGLPVYGYAGHPAVLRSICDGLKHVGVSYNINPQTIDDVGDTVIVTAHVVALYQAIGLKRRGLIKYLIAGPNLVERPTQLPGGFPYDEIDCYLVPSRWVRLLFEADAPQLCGKIRVWHAGVNTEQWSAPMVKPTKKEVLFYYKSGPELVRNAVKSILQEAGWSVHSLVYGSYTHDDYHTLLSRVQCAIVMSKSETQGIALAEAWSMNVPTLVWDPGVWYDHGDWYQDISAAPYLTGETGIAWQTLHDFKTIIESLEHHGGFYNPRAWVMKYMSDQVSAQYLCAIITSIKR